MTSKEKSKEYIYNMWINTGSHYSGHIETVIDMSIKALEYIKENNIDTDELISELKKYDFNEREKLMSELVKKKQINKL